MSESTSHITRDAEGNIWEYVPPNMVLLASSGGKQVSYGPAQTLAPGEALAPGIWRVVNAGLEASPTSSGVEVEPVIIT